MFVIRGHLQDYAWGIPGGLNPWLAQPAGQGPQAELWFGAHPNGPSPLVGRPGVITDVVDASAVPLLVKLLAAAKPLSIQIHPEAKLAQQIFTEQDPQDRLLPDDRAKIEMLVAIEPFEVFTGTRHPDLAARLLRAADPGLQPVAQALVAEGFPAAVRLIMAMSTEQIDAFAAKVISVATHEGLPESAVAGLRTAVEQYPGDPGVLVAVLLDHDVLSPGEATYMPAGAPHAYIRGFGLEVMTASDNVLRLGMTGKRIALAEALAAVDPQAVPQRLPGDQGEYRPVSAPFAVEALAGTPGRAVSGRYRLAICVTGHLQVSCPGNADVVLAPGEAVVVLAQDPDVDVVSEGLGFLVWHEPGFDGSGISSDNLATEALTQ